MQLATGTCSNLQKTKNEIVKKIFWYNNAIKRRARLYAQNIARNTYRMKIHYFCRYIFKTQIIYNRSHPVYGKGGTR